MTDCRICDSGSLSDVLDLGAQPPANSLRYPSEPAPAPVPLRLVQCLCCQTAQITATVRPQELFGNYLWVTGTSAAARRYSGMFVDWVEKAVSGLGGTTTVAPRFVVEVASNDGTFLRRFQDRGWQVLGVEPAGNIAREAVAAGVFTVSEFFTADVADDLMRKHGCADVVVARNVVPHVADIHSLLEGLTIVSGDSGVVVIEAHAAEVILSDLHYDSIYHEHLFYFSLETLCRLCERHGLYPFDMFESPISGGSTVVFFSQQGRPWSKRLREATDQSRHAEVDSHDHWLEFADASKQHAENLKEVVGNYSRSGKVVGYGASARSSTMLNFAEITNGDVAVVIDQNELKQGRLTAGTEIPIVSPEAGLEEVGSSDAILLLAWNFEEEIVGLLRRSGFRGNIIVPLPRTIRIL